MNLEAKPSDSNNNGNNNNGGNNNGGNNNNGNNNNGNSSGLDIKNLTDGVYSITGNMVKIDKTTASMSDAAINHTIKLTVKNGKYYITLNFNGLIRIDPGSSEGWICSVTGIRTDYGRYQLWYRYTASIPETGLELIKSNNS